MNLAVERGLIRAITACHASTIDVIPNTSFKTDYIHSKIGKVSMYVQGWSYACATRAIAWYRAFRAPLLHNFDILS